MYNLVTSLQLLTATSFVVLEVTERAQTLWVKCQQIQSGKIYKIHIPKKNQQQP